MTRLLEKDAPFEFDEACLTAFDLLKQKLTQAPIMITPDWNLPFEIMCDASDSAVGAVLGQRKDKHFQPIHYASKTLTPAQENYRKGTACSGLCIRQIPPLSYLVQGHRLHKPFSFEIFANEAGCQATPHSLDSITPRIRL